LPGSPGLWPGLHTSTARNSVPQERVKSIHAEQPPGFRPGKVEGLIFGSLFDILTYELSLRPRHEV